MTIREPFNAISHAAGALLALIGTIVLLLKGWGIPAHTAALAVYGISLAGLFSASAAYHWAVVKPAVLQKLRKLDHSAIYLLIAGTYTPFTLVTLRGPWGWSLFGVVWTAAIGGIVFKSVALGRARIFSVLLYVVMGWCVLVALRPLVAGLRPVPCATRFERGLRNSGFALRQSSPFFRSNLRCSATPKGPGKASGGDKSLPIYQVGIFLADERIRTG